MVETHDLKGKTLVIEPADANLKKKLERIVVKLGGKVEQVSIIFFIITLYKGTCLFFNT